LTWRIHGVFIAHESCHFYGEERLRCNFTIVIFWVVFYSSCILLKHVGLRVRFLARAHWPQAWKPEHTGVLGYSHSTKGVRRVTPSKLWMSCLFWAWRHTQHGCVPCMPSIGLGFLPELMLSRELCLGYQTPQVLGLGYYRELVRGL
jgi:hypothetical protein